MTDYIDKGSSSSEPEEAIVPNSEEDFASAYAEYDRYAFLALKSIKFKDKSIEEWLEETAIPEVSTNMTLAQLESMNYFAINLIEKVNRNYAQAKSTFDLAAIKYQAAYTTAKIDLIRSYQETKTKIPNAEMVDTLVSAAIKDIYMGHKVAELFCEFWRSLQAKVKSFDARLTSIGMIHNIEKRNVKYEQ